MAELLKTLVVLGARGDMTGRLLLPALVRLAGSGALPEDLQVLAVDRDEGEDESYRTHARAKFATLCNTVVRDPAILEYLDEK